MDATRFVNFPGVQMSISFNTASEYSVFLIGEKRQVLESEKGIVVRFVIGHRWELTLLYRVCVFYVYYAKCVCFVLSTSE